jgi:uncharacterized protein (DUF3084 family)
VRSGNDKIESTWGKGSDWKLEAVQENVAKLTVRSQQQLAKDRMLRVQSSMRFQQLEDSLGEQLYKHQQQTNEKVTELDAKIDKLSKDMHNNSDMVQEILLTLQRMS